MILGLNLAAAGLNAAEGVEVKKEGDAYTVKTTVYSARVHPDASIRSLVIEGVEFMAPVVELAGKKTCPPVYACPMNQWNNPYGMPEVKEQKDNVIRAEGHGWTLEYTFLPEAIEVRYGGSPDGGRAFNAGYPPAELVFNFSTELERACDPEKQGDLGWPVTRNHDPGDFAILAKNGAGLIVENAKGLNTLRSFAGEQAILTPPHRLNQLVINTYDQVPPPFKRIIRLFKKADIAHSLTMEVTSPNRGHIFPKVSEITFPVKVRVLYGNTLNGTLAFEGSPYVWKQPEVRSELPLTLSDQEPVKELQLTIRPPKPAHYTGLILVKDGSKPLYGKQLGFLFRPEEIPAADPPKDFDAFWDHTLAELEKIPLDLTMEPQADKETAAGKVYKVKYRSWDNRWAWAWLYEPKAAAKVPATIWCPPVSVYQPPPAGPADGSLRIMVAIHGGDLKDWPAKPDFDYMNTGITNRETYMLRYSFSCLARGYDIIRKNEKCNGETFVEGSSQGGGLSLVLAGIRPVTKAKMVVPALCRIDWTVLGHTKWGPGCPPGQDPKQIAEVARYFDPANFAHRIHAPLKLGFGLFDFCAPGEAIYTAINALPKDVKCEIFVDPFGGHFSFDYAGFNKGEGMLEAPRWYGSSQENKLAQ